MKKNLKPTRRKGVFYFLNKQKVFHNLLKTLISGYSDHYRVIPEDSSCSNVSGDIHFRLEERPPCVHSTRTVDLFYRARRREIKLTFCKAVLPKGLSRENCIKSVQILSSKETGAKTTRTMIKNWFKNEGMRGFKTNVIFCTEFPLFNYKKTFITETVGSTLAGTIADDIFISEVSRNSGAEVNKFQKMFRTEKQMCDSTLHCSVFSLDTDKKIEDASTMMEIEIGHRIYQNLAPVEPAKKEQPRWKIKDYFKNIFSAFRWMRQNFIPGRVQ